MSGRLSGEILAVLSDTLSMYNLQTTTWPAWPGTSSWRIATGIAARPRPTTEDLQAALFPDGLKIVSASYLESAGQAGLRNSALTDARRAVLAGIPMQGGTLLDLVTQWNQVGVGMGMGNMQNQRARCPDSHRR